MSAYLDHAASTPVHPAAVDAVTAHLGEVGNASSLHASGRQARRVVEEAREQVAEALGARPSEVVFTGGGTESDNLAVKGLFWSRRARDPRRVRVVASAVEHHAVLDALFWLERAEGATVVLLPVDSVGRVDPETLAVELATHGDETALVTVMTANNEVGTVQPIAELAACARDAGVPFHSDAVQALGQLPLSFAGSGASAMTVSGHKCGAPQGVGALLLGREVGLEALLHGGGQERGVRSGTLDVPSLAGFAAGVTAAVAEQPERAHRLGTLRDALVAGVCAAVPDAVVNGPAGDVDVRLPGLAHLSFPGCEGDALLMLLDAHGVECSTGSACQAGVSRPSHVLLAMGASAARARGSLRLSLGHTSTEADVEAVVAAIGPSVERARRASLATARG